MHYIDTGGGGGARGGGGVEVPEAGREGEGGKRGKAMADMCSSNNVMGVSPYYVETMVMYSKHAVSLLVVS